MERFGKILTAGVNVRELKGCRRARIYITRKGHQFLHQIEKIPLELEGSIHTMDLLG
jgi:predicted transcriptional regulator